MCLSTSGTVRRGVSLQYSCQVRLANSVQKTTLRVYISDYVHVRLLTFICIHCERAKKG